MTGISLYYLGDQAPARAHLERVLHYGGSRAGGSMLRVQYEPRLAAASYLSPVLWLLGFPDQAMRVADAVIQEARESGQGLAFALALVQAGCPVALWSGDLTAAEDFVGTLTETAASSGLGFWLAEGRCFEAILRVIRGDVDGGREVFDHALRQLRDFNATMNMTGYETAMAGALAEAGADAAGMAMVREALARAGREEDHRSTPELLRLEGEFLLRKGAWAEAEERFHAAIAAARGQQALSWELRAAMGLAGLLLGQGQALRAREVLAPVHARFTEGFETVDLLKAKLILDGIG